MYNNIKDIFVVVVIIILSFLSISLYTNNSYLRSKNNNYKVEIDKNIAVISNAKSDNEKANALIKELKAKNGEQAILINKINSSSHINAIGTTKAVIPPSVNRESNKTAIHNKLQPKPNDDAKTISVKNRLEYFFTKIYAKDSADNNLLMGWAMFFPNEVESKRWRTGTYPLEFNHTVIETEHKDGTFDRAVEVHITNGKNSETRDREYPIDIKDIKWERFEISDKSMSWWNPRISIGSMVYSRIAPALDISLMSYGRTEVDMDWRFLSFGVGYHKSRDISFINATFTPVSWNVGKCLPIIDNLFIGPQVIVEDFNSIHYGAGISVPF